MKRRGFTLIEILVVVGILVILIGILIPVVGRMNRSAKRTRIAMDLQTISMALEQYNTNWHDYPRPIAANTAPVLLGQVLTQPASVRAGGQKFGPYITDTIRVGKTGDKDVNGDQVPVGSLLDAEGNPILYYVASLTKPNIAAAAGYVDSITNYAARMTCLYNYADNDSGASPKRFKDIAHFRVMLGDVGDGTTPGTPDGAISGNETAKTTAPFILWSAGPDGQYGPTDKSGSWSNAAATAADAARSDDVTNFQQ